MAKSIVGPVINSKRMIYGPSDKLGTMIMFTRILDELGFYIEEIIPENQRMILRRELENGFLEKVETAFTFISSEARRNGYLEGCDLLVCWKDDWGECPVEVLELKPTINIRKITSNDMWEKVVGKSHKKNNSEDISAPKTKTDSESETPEEELRKKFNQTIKEIDERIKDLF